METKQSGPMTLEELRASYERLLLENERLRSQLETVCELAEEAADITYNGQPNAAMRIATHIRGAP